MCQDLEPPGFTGHKRSAEEQRAALTFAQRMRDNGVPDFADASPDGPLIDIDGSKPGLKAAMEASVVLAEEPEHPEMLVRWRATVGSAGLRAVEKIVERASAGGQARPRLKAGIVGDLIVGAYLAHYTHEGPPDHAWARQVVDTLRPALERERSGRTDVASDSRW